MKKISFVLMAVIALSSCVSKKQYNDMLASQQKSYNEAQNAKRDLADCNVKKKELSSENDRLNAAIAQLTSDTVANSKQIYSLKQEIAALKDINDDLTRKLGNSKSEEEVKLLLADLQKLHDKLQAKEDELKKAESLLSQNQAALNEKQKEVAAQQKALDEQSQRLKELTEILEKKDAAMKELKNKVSQALVGFEGNGLSVTNKNGKIYVSLDEQLLFKSGKWDVDPKGVTAIENLAKLLAENPDIHVLVEGHTDDVPYNGSGQILDNWDLSVKRATAIVRILLTNKKIDPVRITAAGRSQYLPVDPAKTPEARQKNRRTEIILSPNLDELMELLSK
jgi:chemotaxis protein MotB